jgi:hypothetical protein
MIPVLPLIQPNRNEKIENRYPLQRVRVKNFIYTKGCPQTFGLEVHQAPTILTLVG